MRISYLLIGIGSTGGPLVLYNFMDNLVMRGHEVYAILPNKNIKWEVGIWKSLITENRNKYSVKNMFNHFKNYLKFRGNLEKIITSNLITNWVDSDITIATHCLTAKAAYFLADRTVPLYHIQHYEEIFFKKKEDRLKARASYYLPLKKICNSKWLQNIMKNKINEKSYLLNPGINLSIFKTFKNPNEKYRDKKEWTIVSLLDEKRDWKGFEDASKSIAIARKYLEDKDIKIKWKVFGLHSPSKDYKTKFEYVGKLFNEDLAKLYSSSDMVLLTSWYESFPLPPLEAMACGSVVITTQYGTEDYVFDGENGLVCLPRQIDEIAKRIVYAVENPNKCLKMVENGLKTVQNYTWEKRTDDLEKILKESIETYSLNEYKFVNKLVEGTFTEDVYKIFE